jgi:hypothetical protein
MSSRILTEHDRQLRITQRKLQTIASQHAAVGAVARHAKAGVIQLDRAIALIEAIVQGYAVPHWVQQLDGSSVRLTITADPNAPPEVRAMLEQPTIATLDQVNPEGDAA